MSLTAVKDKPRELDDEREWAHFHGPPLGSPFTPGQAVLTTLWELVVRNTESVTDSVLTPGSGGAPETSRFKGHQGSPEKA
jgi:hypothetical protein